MASRRSYTVLAASKPGRGTPFLYQASTRVDAGPLPAQGNTDITRLCLTWSPVKAQDEKLANIFLIIVSEDERKSAKGSHSVLHKTVNMRMLIHSFVPSRFTQKSEEIKESSKETNTKGKGP